MQEDGFDGFIPIGGDFRADTVNPTQGAGDFGRRYTPLLEWEVGEDFVAGEVEPYDYTPHRHPWMGEYRRKTIAGRYPRTGWRLRFRYELRGAEVRQISEWRHEDAEPHHLLLLRSTLHLNAAYFQRPLENEAKRIWGSHCDDLIDDREIVALAPELGLRLRFWSVVDTAHKARFADYATGRECAQLPAGEANNVSLWSEARVSRWVEAGETFHRDMRLRIEEAR